VTSNREMLGHDSPSDKKVPVRVGDWDAMKRALWRSRGFAEIAATQAVSIIEQCDHLEGCPGASSEDEPCEAGCPDREMRMSALVILAAARQLAPANARKPADGPYFAPTREYFSEVLAAFSVMQIENELLRERLRKVGIELPTPGNSNEGGVPSTPQLAPAQETP
jgi:hypothetical protein